MAHGQNASSCHPLTFYLLQSTHQEMRSHENNAADHLHLLERGLEETRFQLSETQHHVQEISNKMDILESKIQVHTIPWSQ